jgi:hypothetical protein
MILTDFYGVGAIEILIMIEVYRCQSYHQVYHIEEVIDVEVDHGMMLLVDHEDLYLRHVWQVVEEERNCVLGGQLKR